MEALIGRLRSQVSTLLSSAPGSADIRALAMMVSELRSDRINMPDGIFDPLQDTSDIGTLTNADTSVAGRIRPTPLALAGALGTLTGSPPAAWTDDVLTGSTSGTFGTNYGKDFGAGTPRTVTRFVVYGSTSRGTNTAGGTGRVFLEASNDNSNWVSLGDSGDVANVGSANWVATVNVASPASYRYYRWRVTNSPNDSSMFLAETVYFAGASALTLISNSFTAASTPSRARLSVQARTLESFTLNTDLVASVSRDGGTTWTNATLVAETTLADGTIIYVHDGLDISAQPAGTAMRWRVVTANGRNIEINGIGLRWAA